VRWVGGVLDFLVPGEQIAPSGVRDSSGLDSLGLNGFSWPCPPQFLDMDS